MTTTEKPGEAGPEAGPRFFRDTATVFQREITPSLREPTAILFSMAQPLLFLFLFGPLLAGTSGFPASPWQWFVPGILVMMCLFGPMMAGYNLLVELGGGSLERMLVTPLNRSAMLVGRTLKEFALLLVQAVLLIALSVPLGFQLHPAGVLAGLALLLVFGVGLGSLSYVLAIAAHPGGELFYAVTQLVLFPLMLLSGVLLPMDFGPAWLQVVARINPVSHIADAERALFAGQLLDPSVLAGGIAAVAIAALGLLLGTRAMKRGV
ncbi:ABC-2 type transport system permease protein [Saccharopolyspora antimicrobica]|uniref:Transport permease protein n=1 Tax=Saccharopolyspora antimicrobica TaxID=455193 RepID=A0A1I4S581_9PSEU|nr:ABC transporter permease [Saccharopolyspora antimicrobica]RKT87595.1 ABC-2 type transport system permease protein [Saccharopolyspora antimicrobica]SFM59599.1 ABC-2 type transport system permease protein [Saccharopolyspora antimicrobica]